MADELQALLDRINEEGLKKADEERQAILEDARKEAKGIVAEAKSEAEGIVKEARKQADLLREKGEESLRQAARDVLLSLRQQLEQRVVAVAKDVAASGLSDVSVAPAVASLIKAFAAKEGAESNIEVLLSEEDLDTFAEAVKGALDEDLRERVNLAPVAGMRSGFKLSVSDSSVSYDFSDEALAEALGLFLNDRLSEIVNAAADEDQD